MKHEDFKSLEVEEVLKQVFAFSQHAFAPDTVHWLSAYGLARVRESSNDTWRWAFSTAEVVGKHVTSSPPRDVFSMYHIWRQVAMLFGNPGAKSPYASQTVAIGTTRYYALPLVHDLALQGILLFESSNPEALAKVYSLFRANFELAAKYVAFAYQHLEAKNLSFVDELTGLHNQRYLPTVLEHEIERAKREKTQFSLLFLDIDFFKTVNDGRGHWVGSKLLIELGKLLKGQVRACDYSFRYGGDEFIILLAGTNAENSVKVAERIRNAVETHVFVVEGQEITFTVSIGLAAYPDNALTAAGLIQIADQAMYYGKRKSRNIVFVAS